MEIIGHSSLEIIWDHGNHKKIIGNQEMLRGRRVLGFLVSRFLVFLVSWFLGFLVSKFLVFLVSWFQGFLVSKFVFLVSWLLSFLVSWLQSF